MLTIYDLLKGHDLRSIGKSNEVVKLVTSDPDLFDEVFNGIFHEDNIIRALCADAVEKVARAFPAYIQKKKSTILKNLPKFKQKEVLWHVATMIGYLKLTSVEMNRAAGFLFKWLKEEESIIVKVMCMQTLAELSINHTKMRKSVRDEIQRQMVNGAPGVKARGRKLIKLLESVH